MARLNGFVRSSDEEPVLVGRPKDRGVLDHRLNQAHPLRRTSAAYPVDAPDLDRPLDARATADMRISCAGVAASPAAAWGCSAEMPCRTLNAA